MSVDPSLTTMMFLNVFLSSKITFLSVALRYKQELICRYYQTYSDYIDIITYDH